MWNLTAALERLAPDDDVVAFIDADTLPTPEWLPRLVAVLVNSGRPVATGYRWMTPSDDRWSSSCLAAANASIAALPRGLLPLATVWGGSVAMRRATLNAIRLGDYWRGAISDDVQMSAALRGANIHAHAPRQGLLLTPVSPTCATWDGFRDFCRSDMSKIKELERPRGGFARVVTAMGIDGRCKPCPSWRRA